MKTYVFQGFDAKTGKEISGITYADSIEQALTRIRHKFSFGHPDELVVNGTQYVAIHGRYISTTQAEYV